MNQPVKKRSKFPVWLTTLIVIVMIMLFSLIINQAGEKEAIEQYGKQSVSLAKAIAAGMEILVDGTEKNLIMISRQDDSGRIIPDTTTVCKDLGKTVEFIARQDKSGRTNVLCQPLLSRTDIADKVFKSHEFAHIAAYIKKTKRPIASHIFSMDCGVADGTEKRNQLIIIGMPTFDDRQEYTGALFAAISLSSIIERYIEPSKDGSGLDILLADDKGDVMIHQIAGQTETNTGTNECNSLKIFASSKNEILEGKAGYNEYKLSGLKGETLKGIVTHAPINLDSQRWSMVIMTPYPVAISQIKKTLHIVTLEAIIFIATVVIGSLLIVFSGRRRLRIEEELRLLQERNIWREQLTMTVERIIDGSPIPTFVIDRNHKISFWNKACTELTGYDAKDMIGTDMHYKPFYPDKRPVIADLIVDGNVEGLSNYYAKQMIRKSTVIEGAYEASDYFENLAGKNRHLYFLAAPLINEKGETIAAIETLQDVTAQEELARELRENAETLSTEIQESITLRHDLEQLYNHIQTILDSSPGLIFSFNRDGIINYISRRPSHEGETQRRKWQGQHINDIVAPENQEFILKKWDEEIKKGIYKPFEMTVTGRSGSKRNLLISSAPIKGTDNYLIIQNDITEFKNLEEKFYESQKLAAVGHLSAGIAHEVRNPLSSIKMSLQILEKRLKPVGNDLKRFEIARKEVEHLEKIVNDILTYAKPTEPEMKSTDIHYLLESSLMMAEKALSEKNIKVECNIEQDIPRINIDSSMLLHAFLNIHINAIDAMDKGGTLSLRAKFSLNGKKDITIEITDNGCGIDEEDISQLFNPFFTKKKYGTGLGLTQVKKFIDLHHGNIAISSKKGEGTKVVVTLPIEG